MENYILSLEIKRIHYKTKKHPDGEKLLYAYYGSKVSRDNLMKILNFAREVLLGNKNE